MAELRGAHGRRAPRRGDGLTPAVEPEADPGADGAGGDKRYRLGTHRARLPEETLEVLRPQLARFGVTRVADVTGLDRIGVPVYMAIRPNARALAVSQGKGIEPAAAKASAVMEAVELWHAEQVVLPVQLESYLDLRARVAVADPYRLCLIRDSLFAPGWPIPWVEGRDVATGEPWWVPFELVHANTTVPPIPGSGCFDRGTNGLASGNTLAEAVLHGLCEVVERDALALWERGPRERRAASLLDLDEIDASTVVDLLERFGAADIGVVAWDVTSDVGLATFRVVIFDLTTDSVLNPLGAAFGAGCHPDPEVALTRALTEAAQSRLTAIAGSRDDLAPYNYGVEQAEQSARAWAVLRQAPATADFRSVPARATPTVAGDVAVVRERLGAVGVPQAIVVDLSRPGTGIHVARVIVPGLEGPTESVAYRPGARVRALAQPRADR